MMHFPAVDATSLLFCGYVLCTAGLNLICLLISGFYQKKFDERSPKIGFVAGIIAGLIIPATFFVGGSSNREIVAGVQIGVSLAGGAGSAWSAIRLYFTMKRSRK